jgi:hypothetical protein
VSQVGPDLANPLVVLVLVINHSDQEIDGDEMLVDGSANVTSGSVPVMGG